MKYTLNGPLENVGGFGVDSGLIRCKRSTDTHNFRGTPPPPPKTHTGLNSPWRGQVDRVTRLSDSSGSSTVFGHRPDLNFRVSSRGVSVRPPETVTITGKGCRRSSHRETPDSVDAPSQSPILQVSHSGFSDKNSGRDEGFFSKLNRTSYRSFLIHWLL